MPPTVTIVCVAADLSSVASGVGGCRKTVAVLCVGGKNYPAYSLPERGFTQRVASRSRASTGCSGLCPLLILSHTLSYFPIHSHNLSRGKQALALRRYIVCRSTPHTPGFVTLRRGKRAVRLMAAFYGKIWEGMGEYEIVWEYCRRLVQHCGWRLMPQNRGSIVRGRQKLPCV